jgi:hypothetical protein
MRLGISNDCNLTKHFSPSHFMLVHSLQNHIFYLYVHYVYVYIYIHRLALDL